MEKVADAVKQHKKKMTWLSDEENRENRSAAQAFCHCPPIFKMENKLNLQKKQDEFVKSVV